MIKPKTSEESALKVGDCMILGYCPNKVIAGFEKYSGPHDFIARVALFTDGSKMSLDAGRNYWILEVIPDV